MKSHIEVVILVLCIFIYHPSKVVNAFQSKSTHFSAFQHRNVKQQQQQQCFRKNNQLRLINPKMSLFAPSATQKIRVKEQQWEIIPDIWESLSKLIPQKIMLVDSIHGDDTTELSYSQANSLITSGAASLQKQCNILPGDCVSIFAENSAKWFITEQSVMKAGGCNAVRGALAPVEELRFIYENSKSVGVVFESLGLLEKLYAQDSSTTPPVELKNDNGPPRFIIVLYSLGLTGKEIAEKIGLSSSSSSSIKVFSYEEWVSAATPTEFKQVSRDSSSTATLVYTSGTQGKPKGVVLAHSNLLYQIVGNSFNRNNGNKYDPFVGDVFLSILPCWHIFERTAEYWCLARGSQLVYSNLRNFKTDFSKWKPHFLVAVPRLLENIHKGIVSTLKSQPPLKKKLISIFTAITQLYIRYKGTYKNMLIRIKKPNLIERFVSLIAALLLFPLFKLGDLMVWKKIRDNLGGRLKVVVSGGSTLPMNIESFFEMVGLNVIVGYGLTESSPVICSRLIEHNLIGSVGRPNEGTTVKIVDPDTRNEVAYGDTGVLMAKGPGITKGYMQDEETTRKAFENGYFDTGDLARFNPSTGDVIITGRAKDLIVLSNGENVAPQPIEEAISSVSPLIDQVLLVGQDQRQLSALCVLNPSELARLGLIDPAEGKNLESILGLTPTSSGPAGDVQVLRDVGKRLNEDAAVKAAVTAAVNTACAPFKAWEKVGSIHVLLEPFSVSNGLLTQTLKMKRVQITQAYQAAIDKIYSRDKN